MREKYKISLNTNWKFRPINNLDELKKNDFKSEGYLPADVPGTVHTDLLNNNIIDDPFYSDNEKIQTWIAENDWEYKTIFRFDEETGKNFQLVFEGLDTIAEIYLNDLKVGSTKNMFIKHIFDISKLLLIGENRLKVVFSSPLKVSEKEEKKYGILPVALNSSRVYLRKAQYSFGWDWGPSFPTSGIWKDVYIEEKRKDYIDGVTFTTKTIGRKFAKVEVNVTHKVSKKKNYYLSIDLTGKNHIFNKKSRVDSKGNTKVLMNIENPELWWPNGEGEQILYELSIKLTDEDGNIIDSFDKKVGIRTITLVRIEKNKNVFKFKINNRTVFCKGANWIPADSFLNRVTKDRYFQLLESAKQANMNMIRVWGGGIYESDTFYSLCDELGLLVWQDFMFACGAYPEHPDFIKSVKEEVSQNVMRIQYHPSIALWCGNNENEWSWSHGENNKIIEMPGYKIYHDIIPKILQKIDPGGNYWPSSPFGDDNQPNSFESGNTHQWGIWSGWVDYDSVIEDKSLFVSEFGFQGPANRSTFNKCLPKKSRKVQSSVFEHHNKQVEGPERIFRFLAGHLPIKTRYEDFIYLSQLNQGLALKTCLEHWVTNNRTSGSLIWQLNDCWPVTSWSIIDSELTPKLSYYFVKNIFNPQIVKISKNKSLTALFYNFSNSLFSGKIIISVVNGASGKIIRENKFDHEAPPLSSRELKLSNKNNVPDEDIHIVSIYDSNKILVHRNFSTQVKWKHLSLPPQKIKLTKKRRKGKNYINILAKNPLFFADLYNPNLIFKNRGFILLPGENIDVEVENISNNKIDLNRIKCFCLNDYLND